MKKIKVSFIIHFYFGEYSFSLDTFWIYVVFWKKKKKVTLHSLCVSVLVNTSSVSILFEYTLSNNQIIWTIFFFHISWLIILNSSGQFVFHLFICIIYIYIYIYIYISSFFNPVVRRVALWEWDVQEFSRSKIMTTFSVCFGGRFFFFSFFSFFSYWYAYFINPRTRFTNVLFHIIWNSVIINRIINLIGNNNVSMKVSRV